MTVVSSKIDTRFDFGQNWAEYASDINAKHIMHAKSSMDALLDDAEVQGKSFIDIGCGSGLHALVALHKGAAHVTAVDYDYDSVRTTKKMLSEHWKQDNYRVLQDDILKPSSEINRKYEIVYSWGVLHHTGNVWKAIENALQLVKPGGVFVLALYKTTPLCGFWKIEKKFYAQLPKPLRIPLDYLYAFLYLGALSFKGENPFRYTRNYYEKRGMKWMTDVRDWLGGYPYEPVSPEEMEQFAKKNNLEVIKILNVRPTVLRGLFGTGCAEYVYRKKLEKRE